MSSVSNMPERPPTIYHLSVEQVSAIICMIGSGEYTATYNSIKNLFWYQHSTWFGIPQIELHHTDYYDPDDGDTYIRLLAALFETRTAQQYADHMIYIQYSRADIMPKKIKRRNVACVWCVFYNSGDGRKLKFIDHEDEISFE